MSTSNKTKRKGNMAFVVVMSICIMVACLTTHLQTAHTLTYAQSISKDHEKLLSSKTLTEIGVYQFVKELTSITITKNTDSYWLSRTSASVYADNLDTILKQLLDENNNWINNDMTSIIAGSGIPDIDDLIKLSEKSKFNIKLHDTISIDWRNKDNYESESKAEVYLDPIIIEVYYKNKTSNINSLYVISDLKLSIVKTNTHTISKLTEGDFNKGVSIYKKTESD